MDDTYNPDPYDFDINLEDYYEEHLPVDAEIDASQAPTAGPEENSYSPYTPFIFTLDIGVIAVLFMTGIFGNGLAFKVFSKEKTKMGMTCFLMALAVTDSLYLTYLFLIKTVPACLVVSGRREEYNMIMRGIIIYIWPFGYMMHMAGIYLIVMATVDRFMAIKSPLKKASMDHKANVGRTITGTLVFSLLFNIPRFLHKLEVSPGQVGEKTGGGIHLNSTSTGYATTAPNTGGEAENEKVYDKSLIVFEKKNTGSILGNNVYFRYGYYIAMTWIVMYIIPIGTLSILNFKLVLTLHQAEKVHASLTHSSQSQKKEKSITINMIAIVTVFLVCQTPDFVQLIIGFPPLGIDKHVVRVTSSISIIFLAINSAVNCVIYCLFYKRFRRVAIVLLNCRIKDKKEFSVSSTKRAPGTSGSTLSTSIRVSTI